MQIAKHDLGRISDSEDSLTRRCKRVVLRNKYERDAPEIRKWWYHTFELLEADAAIVIPSQYLFIFSY